MKEHEIDDWGTPWTMAMFEKLDCKLLTPKMQDQPNALFTVPPTTPQLNVSLQRSIPQTFLAPYLQISRSLLTISHPHVQFRQISRSETTFEWLWINR